MKKPRDGTEQSRFLNSHRSDQSRLLKAGVLALLLHIAFVAILSLSLKSAMEKMSPSVYRVTVKPLAKLGDGLPIGGPGLPGAAGPPAPIPDEKLKPEEKPKEKPEVKESKKREVPDAAKKQKPQEPLIKDEKVEGFKRSSKKEEKPEKEKRSSESLHEALEEIRKKVALDKIKTRVARREEVEKEQIEEPSTAIPSQGSTGSSSRNLTGTGSGVGTGIGSGTGPGTGGSPTGSGTGSGTGGSPTGSPWGSPFGGSSALQSKLDEYYSTIWQKIKREWTLPGDISKGKADLETTIVIIIEKNGRIQKSWFEKRSGNALYDQMAMRAIKKADPLPPFPKEFSDNTFEIGIRFYPE
jgi:colicin import membrane protein